MILNPHRSPHFNPYKAWLGLARQTPIAGLHITPRHMTMIALQNDRTAGMSARLVALGRDTIPDGAVNETEIRATEPLIATLSGLMQETRLGRGTPTVVTLEPLATTATISDEWESDEPIYEVSQANYDQTTKLVTECGLDLLRVDIVPAALARFGRQMGPSEVALRSPSGWSVLTSRFFTDAERVPGRASATLTVGRDLHETEPLTGLVGIDVPEQLRPVVDPGLDAVAIGAALAGFGRSPLVSVRPAAANDYAITGWPPPPRHRAQTWTQGLTI